MARRATSCAAVSSRRCRWLASRLTVNDSRSASRVPRCQAFPPPKTDSPAPDGLYGRSSGADFPLSPPPGSKPAPYLIRGPGQALSSKGVGGGKVGARRKFESETRPRGGCRCQQAVQLATRPRFLVLPYNESVMHQVRAGPLNAYGNQARTGRLLHDLNAETRRNQLSKAPAAPSPPLGRCPASCRSASGANGWCLPCGPLPRQCRAWCCLRPT